MIGPILSFMIFITIFSHNYISKTQSTLLFLETIFCISIGSFLYTACTIYNRSVKKPLQDGRRQPDFNNIHRILGFTSTPIILSLLMACLDTTSIYFLSKIIYRASLVSFFNVIIIVYLIYFSQYNSTVDLGFLLFLLFLCSNAIPIIVNEKYPSNVNFTLLIEETYLIVINKEQYKYLMTEYLVFMVFMCIRYLANWFFIKIYKQHALIFIMNHINNQTIFSDFCDSYNQHIPLFDSMWYGLGTILLLGMFSTIEMKVPYNYNYTSMFVIFAMIIYSLSVVCLTFILIFINPVTVNTYNIWINQLKRFVRATSGDDDLELTAKNRGSSFLQSRFWACATFSLFTFFLATFASSVDQENEHKLTEFRKILRIFVLNRLEEKYFSLYVYFGILYMCLAGVCFAMDQ
ncbi:hypothetical protein CDIK_2398 [Cucumispora dikerogammari]|nr:hypothetical protein CDIK_2398 [Cucumispora dikerogammari]